MTDRDLDHRLPASVEHLPPPPPETAKQKLTYWRYRAIWEAAARVPEPLYWRLPRMMGAAWYAAASTAQRTQVRSNLARIVRHRRPDAGPDDIQQVVREAYVSYARYWLDAFRLHRMDLDFVLSRSTGEGLEHIDALRDSGEGGVLATGHVGSWDVGAFFTSARDWRLTVVAEVLEPRRLFDRFVALRREIGLGVVPLVRGGDMIRRLERAIADGQIATLLADRDLTKKGPIVSFFGEPCRLPPGVASLARRTGRPFCAGGFLATEHGWHGHVRPPVDISHLTIAEGTQVVAHELEELLSDYPEQWHVFVRNWLVDREPDHPLLPGREAGIGPGRADGIGPGREAGIGPGREAGIEPARDDLDEAVSQEARTLLARRGA